MKKTLKISALICFNLIFFSCASIFNPTRDKITFHTQNKGIIVFKNDTLKTDNNTVELILNRGKENLELKSICDDREFNFIVKPKNSIWNYLNILNYGIGLAVDYKSPRRYNYPNDVYIDTLNSKVKLNYFGDPYKKNDLYFHFGLPHINSYLIRPENEEKKKFTRFFGISLGLDYFIENKQFLNFTGWSTAGVPVPIPAAITLEYPFQYVSSTFLSISNNHVINRLSFGYGLSFSKNNWEFRDKFIQENNKNKTSKAIGFVFPSYLRLSKHTQLGLVYRPSFYSQSQSNSFKYEHLISYELAYKFNLKNNIFWKASSNPHKKHP
jgi:hypothetical protein